MRIAFEIPGEPQGKQRPRWSRVGTYTPTKTKNYETYVKEMFAVSYPEFIPREEGVEMEVRIFMAPSKSVSKKKTGEMINGFIRPTKRPDIDNVLKIIMDALQGLAYSNDKQVVKVHSFKLYDFRPRVEVVMRILDGSY